MGLSIIRRRALVAALLVGGATGAFAADPPYTNRLINSADPYLLLHAHNPVDWYPWGPEAFAKAKAENKPIFLSVGYSTCYWCHVAEKEIYSNPAIAGLMNKWFVNVKVDREERPAVDRFYIVATEMLTGHGAWPNNLFLMPTGEPFYAGSYFPPRDDGGQPGFPTVLAAIHDLWDHHRADQIAPAAKSVMDALRALEAKQDTAPERPVTPRPWLKRAAAALLDSVDPRNGGFGKPGSGPKFPQAPALDLLAVDARLENNADASAALARTLDAMAFGGIDDQLAGGFHRYATDPGWSVPHFEKMLSDNAQLLLRYAGRYARTKNPLYRTVALATARFIMEDLGVKGGGFATALDAETAGVEGATYLWTRAEIEDVLGAAETDRFFGAYALTPLPDRSGDGTGPSGLGAPGVLRVRLPIGETLARNHATDTGSLLASFAADRAKLLAVRERRPQPVRDDKVVSSLNGMAIAALARAGAVLAQPDLVTAATGAADRIWTLAFDEASGTLHHQIFDDRAVLEGDLDDYAALGSGLISLAEATGDARWRARAATLADTILSRFLRKDGRLISGTTGADLLPIALQDGPDADAPSGTSSALALLLRLGAGPGGSRYAAAAATIAGRLAAQIDTSTTSWPSAVVAMAEHPPINATVTGAAAVPPVSPTPTPAVPATADHVHAVATRSGSTVTVVLRIDPGFHVNSDTPTFDYLVPTSVSFAGVLPSSVDYPSAQLFKPGFATQALAVYEGSTRIEARFAADASIPPRLAVVAQACDSETCLPPSTLTVPIAPAADGTAAATP